jgi:hypothetical protein
VQRSQKAMAARYCPTQEHPNAPKQVQEQDGFHEYTCRENRVTSRRERPTNYPLNWIERCERMASKETNYAAGTRVATTDDGCFVIID